MLSEDPSQAIAVDRAARVFLADHEPQARTLERASPGKQAERMSTEAKVGRREHMIERCLVGEFAIGSKQEGAR